MHSFNTRLGVDIGGTFTDVVLETDGQQFSTKVLTTYSAPEDAIIEGIHQVCRKADIQASQIEQIIHGTTLATNALIERRGAKTALITTKGFRDVIEMRTESRFEQYDLNLSLPEPLLPRHCRFTIEERINAKGEVLLELDSQELVELIERMKEGQFESVAVGLLHSYINDSHERIIRDALAKHWPEVSVSLSSEVSPQMREYERFNTVAANAYIKPLMKSYLDRLKQRLANEGISCNIFLMHSGGGIISLESAAEFPVRLVESGPAGGAVFAANIAARYGLEKVVSFDMGGTTAKICLIKDQSPKTSRVFEVARTYRFKKGSGMPISIPVIDMVEIGAGGGSLAHVDSMRQIRVGPESAGSEPGPACYGRGGVNPAVTDADLLLGKLDPNNFAAGSIVLDANQSAQAMHSQIGDTLEMDAVTAAYGVAEVVDENMANAARVHAVENGEELSEYTMIAFGGAAPLHAGRLCEKLGIDRLLVPSGAGVGSAIGFLRAPFSFEANRSVYMRLSDFDSASIQTLLAELKTEADEFVRSCDPKAELLHEYRVYMRYSGQGWEIPVVLNEQQALNPDAQVFQSLFEQDYRKLFDRTVQGMDIEITVWSVNTSTPVAEVERMQEQQAYAAETESVGKRELFDPGLGKVCNAGDLNRFDMPVGGYFEGPAAVVEDETTTIVPASFQVARLTEGSLELLKKQNAKPNQLEN